MCNWITSSRKSIRDTAVSWICDTKINFKPFQLYLMSVTHINLDKSSYPSKCLKSFYLVGSYELFDLLWFFSSLKPRLCPVFHALTKSAVLLVAMRAHLKWWKYFYVRENCKYSSQAQKHLKGIFCSSYLGSVKMKRSFPSWPTARFQAKQKLETLAMNEQCQTCQFEPRNLLHAKYSGFSL